MASELHPWRSELDFFPSRLPCGYYIHFAATPQSDAVRMCAHDFQRHGDAFGTMENACFHKITISPTSLFSANFNRNRVKNHPKPWTCPLKQQLDSAGSLPSIQTGRTCQRYRSAKSDHPQSEWSDNSFSTVWNRCVTWCDENMKGTTLLTS